MKAPEKTAQVVSTRCTWIDTDHGLELPGGQTTTIPASALEAALRLEGVVLVSTIDTPIPEEE